MDSHHRPPLNQELELKLYLPSADPSVLGKQLARAASLSRRKPTYQLLHNIYYDTPNQQLRKRRVALRLRRIGEESKPQWLQTLKTETHDASALSCRGEWESPVANAQLSRAALEATPWRDFDADGKLLAALEPCFATVFSRTVWLVRRRDGSVVEVAFDFGHIEAGAQRAPICELELELKAGQSVALFEVAQQIARSVAVLPANMSKAQRGFLLMKSSLDAPHFAKQSNLNDELPVQRVAQRVLRDMFVQFTSNLDCLRVSDDPEVVHQARIGWRRFKSGVHLFKKWVPTPPSLDELRPLVSHLGELRNLEVALTETLPPLAKAYVMGDAQRAESWQKMLEVLNQETDLQRNAVRRTLALPKIGANLLAITQWLEDLSAVEPNQPEKSGSLHHWADRQIQRLEKQMMRARTDADSAEQLHRARILAKRLRYSTEAMQDLLPRQLTKNCIDRASAIQGSIGAKRDVAQASALVTKLSLDRGIADFLRGVVVGTTHP